MARQSTMFLNDFTVLDLAYLCARQGLQGDSFFVSAMLTGELDHQGFVLDFSVAKKVLKAKIDELADHRCVVPALSSQLKRGETELSFGKFLYRSPATALCWLQSEAYSPVALARHLESEVKPFLPANIVSLRLELREDESFAREANYRYTHGLRYHDGNCQRLFHGHRNPIQVFLQGERSRTHEKFLAELCAGAHFVAAENLLNRFALDLPLETRAPSHPGLGEIRYRSTQGEFYGQVPAERLIILADEPSVENIAGFALRSLQREFGIKAGLEVRAFEGLNKGAIASV